MAPPRLNVIGAGRLGRTLARLWHDHGLMQATALMTRHESSATAAVAFVGAGIPFVWPHKATEAAALPGADCWLLATPDGELERLASELAKARDDWHGTTVFHCSGAASADLLEPLARAGAQTASAHPIHSFAEPQRSLATFTGTPCLIEGDPQACSRLTTLFTAIGARPVVADACDKPLYHAATATASNLMVALLACAENMLATAAGLNPAQARTLLEPLVRQTLDNLYGLGPEDALTGPVARGDAETMQKHLASLATHGDCRWDQAYRALSHLAAAMAAGKPGCDPEGLHRIRNQLDEPN